MATTFAEIVLEVADKVRDSQIDTQIKRDVNNVIRWILRKKIWSWMYNYTQITFPAGTHTINLPSDCDKVVSLNGDLGKLQYMNPNDWLERLSSGVAYTGTPSYYTQMSKGTLTVYPTPTQDTTLWLRYTKQPVFLSDDNDILDIVIPEKYKDVVVYGTCFLIAQTQNDTQAISLYTQLFSASLQDMFIDDTPLQEEGVSLGIYNSEQNIGLPNLKFGGSSFPEVG